VKLWPRVWCLVFFDSRCKSVRAAVSFLVLCRLCAISAAKMCLPARPRLPAGDRVPAAGYLDSYLRMLSSRSATTDNGSQLARCLCSQLSLSV